MARIAFVVTYLLAVVAAVLLLDSNIGMGELALAIWALASVSLGWGTGHFGFALLAFLAVPFAVPFGYPNDYEFSEPLPIWWSVAVLSFFSAGLILLAALAQRIFLLRRGQRSSI